MKACYIHVPFCRNICAYCDFTRCRYHKQLADRWLSVVLQDMKQHMNVSDMETLYIGGGTPTALQIEQLKQLLQCAFALQPNLQEFTVEANVDSLSDEKIELMKAYGVNRISLGVQTLQPQLLTIMERSHTLIEIKDRIQALRTAGIENISVDLMYGLPTQTMAMWMEDLNTVIRELDVAHISLYALTVEEHSAFGRANVQQMEASLEADMYETAITILEQAGFHQYEISNFAKEGKNSLHNQMYWNYEDFLGIGCGASGKELHKRYDNTCNIHTYLTQGSSPDVTVLTKKEEMFEMVMMSLRMKQGLSIDEFQKRFHEDVKLIFSNAIEKEKQKGRLIEENGCIKTTYQGMLLLHDVLLEFMD